MLALRVLVWTVVSSVIFLGVASAQVLNLALTNNSQCFTSDTDNDQSSPVAYDPADVDCVEAGISDLNVFRVTAATSGNGTSALALDVDAGVVVDANPGSTEYQAGRIAYGLSLSVTGTGGANWDLDIGQQMQGLVATVDDGAGSANASASGVNASLNIGPSLSFGATTSRSSGATGSQPFSVSRSGDVIQGSGDTVLTGSLEIVLDAYSECGGFLCLGFADEGAVLFGYDDVSQSSFVTADEYSTWARSSAGDGYTANFSLTLTGGFCGDGTTDPALAEECDDGNTTSGDGCSSNCLVEFCGDGIRQFGLGEQCDDGNTASGDGCSDLCQSEGVPLPVASDGAGLLLALILGALGLMASRMRGGKWQFVAAQRKPGI